MSITPKWTKPREKFEPTEGHSSPSSHTTIVSDLPSPSCCELPTRELWWLSHEPADVCCFYHVNGGVGGERALQIGIELYSHDDENIEGGEGKCNIFIVFFFSLKHSPCKASRVFTPLFGFHYKRRYLVGGKLVRILCRLETLLLNATANLEYLFIHTLIGFFLRKHKEMKNGV